MKTFTLNEAQLNELKDVLNYVINSERTHFDEFVDSNEQPELWAQHIFYKAAHTFHVFGLGE